MEGISKKVPILLLVTILVASFLIMFYVSKQDSATFDEPVHISAGYTYITFGDYRLNPEHPPLVKILAAAPLVLMKLNFPTMDPSWISGVNQEWSLSNKFLFNSGNDANTIIDLTRIGPMLLTLLLIVLIYLFSRESLGEWWALLPSLIFGLSPTVLSNGHYVTTDIGAALGVLIAIYSFNKYVTYPSKVNMLLAGIAFGFALLFKFSTLLLIPFFLLLITIYLVATILRDWKDISGKYHTRNFGKRVINYYAATIIIFIIGLVLIVYPFYLFTTLNYPIQKQQTDTVSLLTKVSCNNVSGLSAKMCSIKTQLVNLDLSLTKHYITRPYAQFLTGALIATERSATGANIYFMGKVVTSGGLLYFPIVYALKEPIPVLILLLLATLLSIWSIYKTVRYRRTTFIEYLGTNFYEFSMFLFILIYVFYSITSPLNIGLRHLMPILPLGYILMTATLKKWSNGGWPKLKIGFISVLLLCFLFEVISSYPYYLSYFNEFVGKQNGYKYVTDSNYDWGQDLKRLDTFVKQNNIDSIAVNYFGGGDINYYLGNAAVPWSSKDGDPRESNIHWLAISVNYLQLATEPLGPGVTRDPEDSYAWLNSIRSTVPGMGNLPKPDYIVGTSIFIYKLNGAPGT